MAGKRRLSMGCPAVQSALLALVTEGISVSFFFVRLPVEVLDRVGSGPRRMHKQPDGSTGLLALLGVA